jgi:hypothetical protein
MFALRIVAQATVSVPVRARAQSRQARQDSAIRSPFPPFVISVIFVVNPTRAIPENHSSHWYRRSPILHFQFSIHQ